MLTLAGWTVLRFTWTQVTTRPKWVARAVAKRLAECRLTSPRAREAPRWPATAARADTSGMAVSAAAVVPAQTPGARLRRIGADALYLLLGFCMAIVALTVSVTGITLSLTLGLLIVGFPVVLLTFACVRWLAGIERHRAALVLGAPIAADVPAAARRRPARRRA